jgi:hypothetical protein
LSANTPIAGEAIDHAIAYVSQFDPEFPKRIQGAGRPEIDVLQSLAGHPLPAVYVRFLERMGRFADWFSLRQTDFAIGSVTERLRKRASKADPRFTLIGIDRGEAGYHAYLAEDAENQYPVVTFPDLIEEERHTLAEWIQFEAGNLPELICRQAFRQNRLGKMKLRESYVTRKRQDDALGIVARIAAEHGFQPSWFSNRYYSYYENEGAVFTASQPPRFALAVNVGATEQFDIEALRTSLVKNLGVIPYLK